MPHRDHNDVVRMEHGVLFLMCVCFHAHREDRESRFLSSRMAIVAAFRSWSGKDLNVVIPVVI